MNNKNDRLGGKMEKDGKGYGRSPTVAPRFLYVILYAAPAELQVRASEIQRPAGERNKDGS